MLSRGTALPEILLSVMRTERRADRDDDSPAAAGAGADDDVPGPDLGCGVRTRLRRADGRTRRLPWTARSSLICGVRKYRSAKYSRRKPADTKRLGLESR